VQSQNCRNKVNFAVEHERPIVAVHLEETDLPDGLSLTLSLRQAILKYEIPVEEYQQKLLARVSSYLDQEVVQPPQAAQKNSKLTTAVMVGAAVVIVLAMGAYFFSQQDVQQAVDAAADPDITVPAQAAETVTNENVDLAAIQCSNTQSAIRAITSIAGVR